MDKPGAVAEGVADVRVARATGDLQDRSGFVESHAVSIR